MGETRPDVFDETRSGLLGEGGLPPELSPTLPNFGEPRPEALPYLHSELGLSLCLVILKIISSSLSSSSNKMVHCFSLALTSAIGCG